MTDSQTEPTPADLKAKRHRALVAMFDEVFQQLRRDVANPLSYEETESLWTDRFFDAARLDPTGLQVQVNFRFKPARGSESLNDGVQARVVVVDRGVFRGCGRREHEHREIALTALKARAARPEDEEGKPE
jgi:hypothetical protein